MTPHWYSELAGLASLGSQHRGPGSLAGLHVAREEHLSQFFTPKEVAAFMWAIVSPAMDAAYAEDKFPIALLDNSVGSARLLQFADPAKHTLAGYDIHAAVVEAVIKTTVAAGFRADFIQAGMEEVKPRNFGVALINPPFSIGLESPHMEPYDCCSFGRYGPNTSCLSHIYAVAQALAAADIVAAVLPSTFASTLATDPFFSPRLRYVARLPGNAFVSEGANVSTAIAVWGSDEHEDGILTESIADLATAKPPRLDILCATTRQRAPRSLSRNSVDQSEPTIKTRVTGNTRVCVCRHNRHILLKFACGLVEAKVRNAVLRDRVDAYTEEHRYPSNVGFKGQGQLDLELHLAQPDPTASFQTLVNVIAKAGGEPDVDPGIYGYLRRMGRRMTRHRVPFGHTIRVTGIGTAGATADLTAKASFLLNPKKWGSPAVKKGAICKGRRTTAGRWVVEAGGAEWPMTDEELSQKFEHAADPGPGKPTDGWVEKFPGRLKASPALAHEVKARAKALGLHTFLSWGFQFDDVCELAASPFNACLGAEMGLGKSRIAIGLFLLKGGAHNLYVTEAHLVPEVVSELVKVGLPSADWQVINSRAQLAELRKINVISYNRLRMPLTVGHKTTYAKALRRRIACVVADEGHCLRNLNSEQTRAMWTLCARKRYIFTGTVVANYPRDTLGMMAWVAGSGTAVQPYGIRSHLLVEPRLVNSMSKARRGVDAYCEDYVTLEWVTHEWREEMDSGAKREVPKISNLPKYREWLAPLVKRRLAHEPEVARHITIPTPTEVVTEVEWSDDHLGFYLTVADDFARWYREARRKSDASGNSVNLISLLARIGAVETACNIPQAGVEGFGSLSGLTSKQSCIIERLVELSLANHKTIVYAKSPRLLNIIARELTARGIASVLLHGERNIIERTNDLNVNFRFGKVPVLLASLGCAQTGLNISQADRVIFASRDWSAKTERQAKARVLRPQQERPVTVEYVHLPGSIDNYQAQLVRWKGSAADAGLDWATPETDTESFAHIDHILGEFVANCAAYRGLEPHALREILKGKAA